MSDSRSSLLYLLSKASNQPIKSVDNAKRLMGIEKRLRSLSELDDAITEWLRVQDFDIDTFCFICERFNRCPECWKSSDDCEHLSE